MTSLKGERKEGIRLVQAPVNGIFAKIEVAGRAVTLHLAAASSLEPRPSAVTSGCSNTILADYPISWPLTPTAMAERKPGFLLSDTVGEVVSDLGALVRNSVPGSQRIPVLLLSSVTAAGGKCSAQFLGPLSCLKSLLTWGDNPVKAAKDHVLLGWKRQEGDVQGADSLCKYLPGQRAYGENGTPVVLWTLSPKERQKRQKRNSKIELFLEIKKSLFILRF